MMNRNSTPFRLGLCAVACAAMSITFMGCTKKEPEPVAISNTPPPPPPPPAAPALTPIDQLMIELNIDQRVVLSEDRAPDTNEDRRAVLEFFDAIARGNAQALKDMLSLSDQIELNALVDSGVWKENASRISKVEIQTGSNALNQKCALAVVEVGTFADLNFQPQLWYYTTDGDEPLFEAAPAPPGILDRLSGDWIASWHQILAAELAMADQPDEDVTLAQQNLDTNDGSPSATSSGGDAPSSPGSPGGPGSPGRLRDPNTTPPARAPN